MTLREPTGDRRDKVFGIGMFKTGTTSLGLAFEAFGYSTFHGPFWDVEIDPFNFDLGKFERVAARLEPVIDSHDAFEDYPFMFIHRYLAERYPSARFILTERDPEAVAFSDQEMWRYAGISKRKIPPAHVFVERYEQHHADVLEHFGESSRLLRVQVGDKSDFGRLCTFLGCADTGQGWPRANVGIRKQGPLRKLIGSAKRILRPSPSVIAHSSAWDR